MTTSKQMQARVYGRVQGVSFRYYTVLQAEALSLTGWTRNEWDGSVTVVAEGPLSSLRRLLQFLNQGPPAARVSRVEVSWSPATGEFTRFTVRSL